MVMSHPRNLLRLPGSKVIDRMANARARSALIIVIGIGAVVGSSASQVLYYRGIPSPSVLSWEHWDVHLALDGATAGGLIANLAWTAADLRARMRRSAAFAVAANTIVWIAFLIVAHALTSTEFERIQAAWNPRDAGSGLGRMSHEPVIVAGRVHRTCGGENRVDRLLGFFAGPAIDWAALVAVPLDRGGPANATRRESYIVGGVGFILSTAFWAAFAPAVSFVVRLAVSSVVRLLGRYRRVRWRRGG